MLYLFVYNLSFFEIFRNKTQINIFMKENEKINKSSRIQFFLINFQFFQ